MKAGEIILGIDPGTRKMGYGVLDHQGNVFSVLGHGTFSLPDKDHTYLKLKKILEFCYALLDEHQPDVLAIEAPFFGKNVQSMLKLGRAQGVCMAAALSREIPVFEYSPARIKQSIAGNGAASKEQLAGILIKTLGLGAHPVGLDASDALGVALCHAFSESGVRAKVKNLGRPDSRKAEEKIAKNSGLPGSRITDWKEFLAKNPEKRR